MKTVSLATAIENLMHRKHLVSANELLLHFKAKGKTYNKTSVYRALDQLVAEEKICKHYWSEEEAKYELRQHHHAHLVCNSCGSVDVTDCTLQEPKKINQFQVEHHHTTLFGLCPNCQLAK